MFFTGSMKIVDPVTGELRPSFGNFAALAAVRATRVDARLAGVVGGVSNRLRWPACR